APSERLRTFDGYLLTGTFLPRFLSYARTLAPLAHTMPIAMSQSVPPHRPITRTGWIFASGATPAMPIPLLRAAATMPATWVPCHELAFGSLHPKCEHVEESRQSPGSDGLESHPSPSPALLNF